MCKYNNLLNRIFNFEHKKNRRGLSQALSYMTFHMNYTLETNTYLKKYSSNGFDAKVYQDSETFIKCLGKSR